MNKVFKVGLIGCGHIAETYFRAEKYFNNIKIIKCADINLKAAKKCSKEYGVKFLSVNEILKDQEVEIILNLTIPKAHYEISKKALLNGKSLLAAGITKIKGNFKKGENVIILDQNNNQLARGLSSFSSTEIDKIKGKQSKEIETILGYLSKTEVIHKDDMVLL